MGINYYLHQPKCEHCGHEPEPLHIGKSSGGWCFSLHVTEDIPDLKAWQELWSRPNTKIYDEYDEEVTIGKMLDTITKRSYEYTKKPFGYDSWGQFHRQNGSEPGPNNLLRHKIGDHCVGHGDGTWDYIIGDFS